MTLSILAVFFLLFLIGIIFYGYGFLMNSAKNSGKKNTESCFICRETFDKQQLVEREIGDAKIVYFCKRCIASLGNDAAIIS